MVCNACCSVVFVVDRTKANSEMLAKVVNALVQSFPAVRRE